MEKEKSTYEILEAAIVGGITGVALGALLTGKRKTTIIAALVGITTLATYQAFKEAEKLETGVCYEEDNNIYLSFPDGTKKLLKKLPAKKNIEIPTKFTLD